MLFAPRPNPDRRHATSIQTRTCAQSNQNQQRNAAQTTVDLDINIIIIIFTSANHIIGIYRYYVIIILSLLLLSFTVACRLCRAQILIGGMQHAFRPAPAHKQIKNQKRNSATQTDAIEITRIIVIVILLYEIIIICYDVIIVLPSLLLLLLFTITSRVCCVQALVGGM